METIEVGPQEIGRVLLNLYTNAFIRSQNGLWTPAIRVPTVDVTVKRRSDRLAIQVKDNGTGIPESVQAKIFQPFFTTKPTGKGRDLVLSLSYDITTKGCGGTVWVESQSDKGATFIIELPQQ